MPVGGRYLAWQLRLTAVPCFRIYRDSILQDVLGGFVNIDQRAEQVAEEAYQRMVSRPAGEDFDGDVSQEAEAAKEQGQIYHEAMVGIRQATINLLAAGLFHLLEQQLARLCADSIFRDYNPPDANLGRISNWYRDHLALDLRKLSQWLKINELRLVANSVKHGRGGSEAELRPLRPALFQNPALVEMGFRGTHLTHEPLLPLAGDGLFVTEEVFAEYAATVNDFVMEIVRHFEANARKSYPRDE